MLLEGLNLMVIGMGTVFAFLALLVLCTWIMSWLVERFRSATRRPEPVPATPPALSSTGDELLAAVSAAVHHHRQRR